MIENRKTMTKHDRKITKRHDKNTGFWQVSFSWVQHILLFSVMFLSCLIDVLDVFMILVRDVPFAFPFRMSPKYGGWNRVPKELMMEIPVKMGCNEIIIICTWNACIIKNSRTKQNKKIIRIFFRHINRAF